MARKLTAGELVVASHNAGKVTEISELMAPFGVVPISAASLGLPEPDETEPSFLGNAQLKALSAAQLSNRPALADDSGLCVVALDDAPGIYSARWAERPDGTRDFTYAMERVEEALTGHTDRTAYFVCALCLAWPDGHCESFEGRVWGEMIWPPRGTKGFGYDPVFVPRGGAQSFAEIDPAVKHAQSHRAEAFKQLVAACLSD